MIDLQISALREGYRDRRFTVDDVIRQCRAACDRVPREVWIHRLGEEAVAGYVERLKALDPAALPLYGVPFVIKDNIDLAGVPTTAGCPDFAYLPARSAFVVERLVAAGAVPLGKTNLDQFATGLVGTRSPYGACPNAFNPAYISGGSSSGSAVAVACGCCSFSLGTDTAGSGRVPAAFNNLVGLKPSKGLLSCSGVVPACRSLDCVSIFALDGHDAEAVFCAAAEFDPADCYARELALAPVPARAGGGTFAVPRPGQLRFFGDDGYRDAFARAVERLEKRGWKKVEIDFSPFAAAAELLYSGPWVSERYAAVGAFIEEHSDSVLNTTRTIILSGKTQPPHEVFKAMYRLQELKRQADAVMRSVDFLLTPTAGTCYTIAEVGADPVALNTNLGAYTNYMNLLDYAAVAVPAAMTAAVPFGVTLVGNAGDDRRLLAFAAQVHADSGLTVGRTAFAPVAPVAPAAREAGDGPDVVTLAVCGAHLRGGALHGELERRGARFVAEAFTAPVYRMYAFRDGRGVYKPGLVRGDSGGNAIYVELYELSVAAFGAFVAAIPAPLGIGKLALADGRAVCGFLAEPVVAAQGQEITGLGDWRRFTP